MSFFLVSEDDARSFLSFFRNELVDGRSIFTIIWCKRPGSSAAFFLKDQFSNICAFQFFWQGNSKSWFWQRIIVFAKDFSVCANNGFIALLATHIDGDVGRCYSKDISLIAFFSRNSFIISFFTWSYATVRSRSDGCRVFQQTFIINILCCKGLGYVEYNWFIARNCSTESPIINRNGIVCWVNKACSVIFHSEIRSVVTCNSHRIEQRYTTIWWDGNRLNLVICYGRNDKVRLSDFFWKVFSIFFCNQSLIKRVNRIVCFRIASCIESQNFWRY